MTTFREKYNKKYNRPKDASNSLDMIAMKTGISKSILQEVYNRGTGAYISQPSSVRNVKGVKGGKGTKMSKEQWSFGRLYAFVMKSPTLIGKGKPDHDLWKKHLADKRKN